MTARVTITMGGGSPRSHATPPATTGADGGDGSYRDWYHRPPNEAAIQAHHALVRDAEAAKEAFERRNPGTYLLAADDPVRVELSRLVKEADALRYEKAPLREPSPAERHAEAVKQLPPIAAIREWGRQWAKMRKERVTPLRRYTHTLAADTAQRRSAKVCPHCGGKL